MVATCEDQSDVGQAETSDQESRLSGGYAVKIAICTTLERPKIVLVHESSNYKTWITRDSVAGEIRASLSALGLAVELSFI